MPTRTAAVPLLFLLVVFSVVAAATSLLADATPGVAPVDGHSQTCNEQTVRSLIDIKKGGGSGGHGGGGHGGGHGGGRGGESGNGNSANSMTPALGGVAIIGAHGASHGGRHNGGTRSWSNHLAAAAAATALGFAVI